MEKNYNAKLSGITLSETDWDRFWDKVKKTEPDACWEWQASTDRCGYGQFRIGGKYGKIVNSHRVAKVITCPEFKQEDHCLHTCDNRKCCNPNHIILGTHADNMKDAAQKNRNKAPRPGNGYVKIQKEQYSEIVELFSKGFKKSQIARLYNVTPATIRNILNGVNHG